MFPDSRENITYSDFHYGKEVLESGDKPYDPLQTEDNYIQLFVNELKTIDPDIVVTDLDSKFV